MSYEIVEETVHTDDGSFGSWIQERTSSTSNSSQGDSVVNPTKTIIRRHGKETTTDNRRKKFQKCLNLKSSMSQSEDNRKAVKHLFIKTKLTDHSSDYSLCGGYKTSTSNSSSNSSSASFGLETFHGSNEQYIQNYQTATATAELPPTATATATPRRTHEKSAEFQTNTNNNTDTEDEYSDTISNTKPEPEVSASAWSNHHENSTKFQNCVKNLLEYKQKFPKIKKSLLYSNSPEFAEYARLLRELSPLSAPTTIYFLYDPVESVYSGKFSLYNKSEVRAAFKIKSSSSKGSYIVSPHWGFIDSKQEIKIFVQVRPRKKSIIRNSDNTISTSAPATKDIITTDNQKRPRQEENKSNTKVKGNQNLNSSADVENLLDAENSLHETTNTSQPKIFKHAALGVFTARVDPALNLQDLADIGKFWEYYEASNPNMIAGHFLKRLLVVQHNGDIHFKTCTHNIFNSIMSQPLPLQASHKKHKRGKEEISVSTSKMNFSTNDDQQLRSLQLYNSLLLEILVSRKTMTEYILKFQILHFILFILIGLIFLRVFDFI